MFRALRHTRKADLHVWVPTRIHIGCEAVMAFGIYDQFTDMTTRPDPLQCQHLVHTVEAMA